VRHANRSVGDAGAVQEVDDIEQKQKRQKANGDLALAGTAFQFPGALTRSGHLNPKERNRYNWYKKTLPIFSKFTMCMIRALNGAEQ